MTALEDSFGGAKVHTHKFTVQEVDPVCCSQCEAPLGFDIDCETVWEVQFYCPNHCRLTQNDYWALCRRFGATQSADDAKER